MATIETGPGLARQVQQIHRMSTRLRTALLAILALVVSACVVPVAEYPPDVAEDAPPAVVDGPPPAARVEVVPAPPEGGYAWVPGFWQWGGRAYVWAPGRYVVLRAGVVWVGPRYVREGGIHHYHGGRWVHHHR